MAMQTRASYDQLIEHCRGSPSHVRESETWDACVATIQAAKFLSAHREGLGAILTAQGGTVAQYLKCAQGIVPLLDSGDFFGLGGFSLIGKTPRALLPLFRSLIHQLIPFLGKEGIKQIHIWGCIYAPALVELLRLCDQAAITLSTDSVGPSLHPVFGQWGYASWRRPTYRRPSGPFLGRHRMVHVALTRCWLAHLREREALLFRRQWLPQARIFF
jgi:hypothetical protein